MLFVNFLKKNAEAGQAFFKKLLLVYISRHAKLYCASLFLHKVSRGTPLPFLFIDNKTRDIPDFHIALFPSSPGGH